MTIEEQLERYFAMRKRALEEAAALHRIDASQLFNGARHYDAATLAELVESLLALIKQQNEALEYWHQVIKETETPVPDLALRARYRELATSSTKQVLRHAEGVMRTIVKLKL